MKIRKSQWEDLDDLNRIYAHGREIMKQTGNPYQWRNTEPRPDQIEGDIKDQVGYVLEDDHGHVYGAFALIGGEDPWFGWIDGEWPNDEPYMTLHRVATDGSQPGVFQAAVETARKLTNNLRVDTSLDNWVMQKLCKRHGFVPCGIIMNRYNDPRIAYHKDFRWEGED